MKRVYLDHNATSPLRAEARQAMIDAIDVIGNPSSVHAEGRQAKALVERARAQVAELVGCRTNQVIFTGSATEAAALAVAQKSRHGGVFAALPTEHDCLRVWADEELPGLFDKDGNVDLSEYNFIDWVCGRVGDFWDHKDGSVALLAISAANSETGVVTPLSRVSPDGRINTLALGVIPYSVVCDVTQMAGKMPVLYEKDTRKASNGEKRPSYMILSAHKLGGPKGVGALINFTADDPEAILRGGGQEMGRRSGTENVIGIAGFGAAAEAAARDVAAGRWDEVEKLRKILENTLAGGAKETIFVGKGANRLPNTSCFATPGWKGETQVMQMDLAGFAISAGSACSSGKVRASTVLRAMGYDDETASSAIRVSLGLETTEQDVARFAEAWLEQERKFRARAA
ncbi:aminotransferase class V-fold PLP-dependent enzyme [uncultured Roseobacter sp.]|uniref:cysteine desulfurase family protein n=1 Tax=uncultured Roseobacter sp. TaxID=114847 RepID=UPI0026244735|nr:aminotransferase class V-fold PLP-dependent enzyme [uncultured Roseobacter sp.]